ncbi:MAG: DUF1232 domain-containing protein [Mailhella sp.]|nr:DUF1232 domain-containing protein [Mailhella sp.]
MFNNLSFEDLGKKLQKFAGSFDAEALFSKLTRTLGPIGKETVRKILQLYYVLQSPHVPAKAKAVIVGALGYVVCPLDFIPDFIPVLGFTDDIAAVTAVLVSVSMYVTEEINRQVEEKITQWFGPEIVNNPEDVNKDDLSE